MRTLLLFSLIAAACAGATVAPAQTYPVRPIRIILPGSAGSAVDFTARAIAQRLTEAWGQQIVIDNRSGAGGIIAHELAAKAAPDGYTLIFSTSAGLVINPLLAAQRLIDMGSEPQSSSPAEFRAYMRKESERWDRVIKAAGLKIER